ncbi:hypothetical protein SAMN05421820_104182 [Pedobacter steynii]|uniref:Uncharacterized protein n=1 Tax=Pedobacter steynii TaxID=430522 RepID=A0A1G9UIF0_9SPHI|nr:hypothetical protein [Pedobacter steynii]NQX40777.1 hypothetical protein [Pedobacter steynii]SDM59686.1 hypothetical protein SAMN05421820_104182 [Pedobacter steynii]
MKSHKRKLKKLQKIDPLSHFYKFGMTAEDIQASILDSLSPFFSDQNILKKYSMTTLATDWLAFLSLEAKDPHVTDSIFSLLKFYNEAKDRDEESCLLQTAEQNPRLLQVLTRFWSLHNNQLNYKTLQIEDFLEESLKVIGQVIEGMIKPYLRVLVQINRIRSRKTISFSEIEGKDLGILVDELLNTKIMDELLIIGVHGIRISQWRNIAYHHNSRLDGGRIFCWCKKDGGNYEFELSRDELADVMIRAINIFSILKLSHTFFIFDNLEQIRTYKIEHPMLREEVMLLDFTVPINSKGFEILDLKVSTKKAILVVRDMDSYSDFDKQAVESITLLYNLWYYSRSTHLRVEYCLFSDELYQVAEIDSSHFEAATQAIKLSSLLPFTKISHSKKKYQREDPIASFVLSENLKKIDIPFLSQKGKPMTIREFIVEFSENSFCNFMLLDTEGSNEVKINISRDGVICHGNIGKGEILLSLMGPLFDDSVRGAIKELLISLTSLYKKMELKASIIHRLRESPYYQGKKIILRDQKS